MLPSRAFRYVALIVSAVASVSCGDVTRSTSPVTAGNIRLSPPTKRVSASFAVLTGQEMARAVRWGPYHRIGEFNASAVIGSAGGTLSIPDADFTMTIPKGALTAPTLISVTALDGLHVAYDMQPHGLRFQRPVTVVQELRNTASYRTPAAAAVRSAYLADRNDRISSDDTATPAELEAAVTLFYGAEPVAETHVWTLNHFSRWILISGVWVLVK